MKNLKMLERMKHSPIRNYAIPGVTSWLIGAQSDAGTVRLFECSREHQEPIIPHSHRFDFHCVVLAGSVRNLIWTPWDPAFGGGDEYQVSRLSYGGAPGKYRKDPEEVSFWVHDSEQHVAGEEYSMTAKQVHSIFFSRGAKVLFFEGPMVEDSSIILEPFVDGKAVPTFKVEPWMFDKSK